MNRRDFIKNTAVASAASVAGLSVPSFAASTKEDWEWDKSVCRFCGTGCGILIARKNGKIVAVKGDPAAPVNRGLNCIKGYFNAKIMYGEDRITTPLLRMNSKGEFDKKGKFQQVSWQRAIDEMEKQFKKTYNELGPTGIGVFGSGQYTIQEGYAAAKLIKAGFRSHNIDPNARHCMASAVVAFIQTFGVDEPSGCYDDIELTDTIVTWGANMAEMHPVLWSRVSDKKLSNADTVKLVNLSTFSNRTSHIADIEIIFRPSTDLAIWNYIAREIVYNHPEAIDQKFVDEHCIFTTGFADIGYGMRPNPNHPKFKESEKDTVAKQLAITLDEEEAVALSHLGLKAGDKLEMKHAAQAAAHWEISFEDFKKGLAPYTLDYVAKVAKGDDNESLEDFKKKLQELANLYIDKKRKVVSFWTMGFNQHTRGTWVNEQAYMVHFLLGKQAKPGNGAFSLTGQPSACGTAREVGTFCHRLPADMVVVNAKHREISEKIWKVPAKTINPVNGAPYLKIMRDLEDGKIKWIWVHVNNPWHNTANANHWIAAAREMDNFIVVSDPYPGISAKVADLILPTAMIYEKWGSYGNAERRTQHWKQQVLPVGSAMSDTWQIMEFAKRFKLKEVWKEHKINDKVTIPSVLEEAKAMGYNEEDTLYDVLFANKEAKSFVANDPIMKGYDNTEVNGDDRNVVGPDGKVFKGYGFFVQKYLWEEYRKFGVGHGHDLADFDTYHKVRGLRWPVVNGKETQWRFNTRFDYYAKKAAPNSDFAFYGNANAALQRGDLTKPTSGDEKFPLKNKGKIFFRPFMKAVERPDENYPFWLSTGRVLEHWHSGTMTMRVPELYRAVPEAFCYMNEQDCERLKLNQGDVVWIESRRGKVKAKVDMRGRNKPPVGLVYVPWFDENVFINKVCLDATCPLSNETDFKKCAVKITKA
ncbi:MULTISPECIES: periplasmic nitrate reductase subunit alpha [unclassified Campylobacter]|uniref:periplasmic nitrate reductase subunit alpha n=1 Tax=unclassified Campylobacter TaxID=2593542 RepID=UPI001237B919|nr:MULTISPECIES: periplasmic nitrate reductase subunit alpha [unclassified Campylobacter]KAA6227342.1 periplasmic nitrate reductase subunit alpha [Campylobacter sp. LR286c]KAA6227970.1 periplasmic nitrate reductase subunit alpha [Campylobacter sp. LR185c]KAA6228380.1 periplasmic nitrate reductase subunit alpha [Campylobacter sp. LR196d]KAA6231186.1 periplasmic nitrate reductase subunit alpha [Campylobacter sp. LR264d]KAA8604527.1 periplasmic nitrate reductase subunit alpha [Campylobacter sp. L